MARFAAIEQVMAANTPAEPHWYLNFLATHPDWQRQGLGAGLIEQVGDVCRSARPAALPRDRDDRNVAYYRHLGFIVRSEWDVPLDGPHMWGMFRAAP